MVVGSGNYIKYAYIRTYLENTELWKQALKFTTQQLSLVYYLSANQYLDKIDLIMSTCIAHRCRRQAQSHIPAYARNRSAHY